MRDNPESRPGKAARLTLLAISGPRPVSIPLINGEQYTIGRRASHAIALEHPEVSKDHAVIASTPDPSLPEGAAWNIVDTNSKHGTRINGVALEAGRDCPIAVGDLIEISPWTFCLVSQTQKSNSTSRVRTVDDTEPGGSTVTAIAAESGRELAHERLRLLLRCAESLPKAANEQSLAEIILETAVAGTGYANAALTRPMTPDGAVDMIAGVGDIASEQRRARLSRSLLHAASQGVPVQLSSSARPLREAVSIAEFGIQEAICVPLMVESTVAGYLYLDSRGRSPGSNIGANEACAFAVGVGRLASMAWANLMRLELERRYARIEGEISAGARAQRMILPKREGQCGFIRYIGECKPGRAISGDFFDVFELPDNRVAVTIGDVTGKGVAASVVMTTTQGFLHGALRQHGDVARAVRDLNEYVFQRCESQIFVTLWAGVFDIASQSVTYADAGHGYVWMIAPDGAMQCLDLGGGPPVGAVADADYRSECVPLMSSGQVLLVSDGIVEQPSAAATSGGESEGRDEFGRDRIQNREWAVGSGDGVAQLFRSVHHFAANSSLADDATVVMVKW